MLDRERPGQIARLDIDLDECLPLGIEKRRILTRGVGRRHFGAGNDHKIGFGHAGIRRRRTEGPEDAKRERMRFGQASLAGWCRDHGNTGRLNQGAKFFVRAGMVSKSPSGTCK